jgi:hypothetical protein
MGSGGPAVASNPDLAARSHRLLRAREHGTHGATRRQVSAALQRARLQRGGHWILRLAERGRHPTPPHAAPAPAPVSPAVRTCGMFCVPWNLGASLTRCRVARREQNLTHVPRCVGLWRGTWVNVFNEAHVALAALPAGAAPRQHAPPALHRACVLSAARAHHAFTVRGTLRFCQSAPRASLHAAQLHSSHRQRSAGRLAMPHPDPLPALAQPCMRNSSRRVSVICQNARCGPLASAQVKRLHAGVLHASAHTLALAV